jgi:hypothetical protein
MASQEACVLCGDTASRKRWTYVASNNTIEQGYYKPRLEFTENELWVLRGQGERAVCEDRRECAKRQKAGSK